MATNRPAHRPFRTFLAPLVGALLLAVSAGPSAGAGAPPDVLLPVPARDAYVAIGDSFSAGTGTGFPDIDPACQRSSLSYPAVIGAQRPNTELLFVACGFGVTTESLVETQVPYLDRSTDFVTLTVGGNDIGFNTIAGTCIQGPTDEDCFTVVDVAEAFIATQLGGRLDAAYDAIRVRVRKAEVIVVGYPKYYADDFVWCPQAYGISSDEAGVLNQLVDSLDAVIAEHARAAGFTYVDPLVAFADHHMCAADPWINGVMTSPLDAYHPTAAGYADGFTPLVTGAMRTREPSVSQVHRR